MPDLYADVAVPVPLHRTFTYSVPEGFRSALSPGCRVLVPFGRNTLTGVVIALRDRSDVAGIKPVRDLLDVEPTFPADLLSLTRWISDYYLAPIGEVMRAAAPQSFAIESFRLVTLLPAGRAAADSDERMGSAQRAVLDALASTSPLSFERLRVRTRTTSLGATLASLVAHGWVELTDTLKRPAATTKRVQFIRLSVEGSAIFTDALEGRSISRGNRALLRLGEALKPEEESRKLSEVVGLTGVSVAILRRLIKAGLLTQEQREELRDPYGGPTEPAPKLSLTQPQQSAVDTLTAALDARTFRTFLLHGVTGSGKTQVYIEALRRALANGRSGIVLVPEIALTPQTVRRFRAEFGDLVSVQHSQLSVGERHDTWRRARRGEARIVIGPRSAIFAPLPNLGLIVVDEEHEGSYKQYDATPRYHGRDTAIVRGKLNDAIVLLGSATPSVESYANALAGKYTLLELRDRIDGAKLPTVALVDMKDERKKRYEKLKAEVKASGGPFPRRLPPLSVSGTLATEIALRLEKKEGTILLQNRRGYAHVLECFECGFTERCANCDVTMTYHLKMNDLHCHYCGAKRAAAVTCPSCRVGELRQQSFGTQQVHEELQGLFPKARIVRMDRDTTRRKGSHEALLNKFGAGEADILLGTQMVAKGLDFPRVTLVGVISAETQLLLPDFRSAERTFQLLTQVAGRAGRSTLRGEVLIQTYQPDHYSLRYAVGHDFKGFYDEERKFRAELRYPPVTRIVLVECSGGNEKEVQAKAESAARTLRASLKSTPMEILGPAEPPIPRLRNQFRRHIIIKNDRATDPAGERLHTALMALVREEEGRRGEKRSVRLTVDVDPAGMM